MGFLGFKRKKEDKNNLCPTDSERSDSKSTLKEEYEKKSPEIKTKTVEKSKPGFWSLKKCVFKDNSAAQPPVETPPPATSFKLLSPRPPEDYPLGDFKFLVKEPPGSWSQSTNCYGSY